MRYVTVYKLAGGGRLLEPGQPPFRPGCRTEPDIHQSYIARSRRDRPLAALQNAGVFTSLNPAITQSIMRF